MAVDTDRAGLEERALGVLCSEALAPVVEMVLRSPAPDEYEAVAVDGRVRFRRQRGAAATRWSVVAVDGRDPLGDQDPARFVPLAAEAGHRQPSRTANSYPHAYERVAQVFDHPCAPDLCVLHTATHRWESHRGEHGSLGAVQSRAPFIASGAGVRRQGVIADHCRMVDVAPTILALLGAPAGAGIGPAGEEADGLLLARQDGMPVAAVIDPDAPPADHVLTVLFDGANPNVIHDAAEAGEVPHLAGLIERGTSLAHGSVASLPTVTLANHTTLLTGAHPGHHGVLHNAWYDRGRGRQVVTESPATWQEAMQWLLPGVETVHEALHRWRPDAVTFSVNEPADRGADYSTFDLFRAGRAAELAEHLPRPLPGADPRWVASSRDYRWGSSVDCSALIQASALWAGEWLGRRYRLPTFCWVSFSLTDSAFHEGGPHSAIARAALADSDARLGRLLAAVAERGVAERTAVLVVADHGMEEVGETEAAGWGEALSAAGIPHRDEASGFVYLGVEDTGPETVPVAGGPSAP